MNGIKGTKGDDTLIGTQLSDDVRGGRGDDYLSGTHGADVIRGGKGRDVIDGGSGHDILYGGKGADTFIVRDLDQIADFQPGRDMIVLDPAGDDPFTWSYYTEPGDLYIGGDPETLIADLPSGTPAFDIFA